MKKKVVTAFMMAALGSSLVFSQARLSADTIQTAIYEGCGIWDEARPWTWGTSRLWMPVPEAL